ncbi:prim-pol domain-containing protein [Crepidotus variabilis]|uniref:DNA primase n=1 Tax=Crepidotus variabilis TaxID=179855 RepID=A0A9P6JKP0_9AGAR|nr:prim-pol domain-containing protein [Crepidotus variabilis]
MTEVESPSPEIMLTFYNRLYPFKSIFAWLNHSHKPGRLFTHREFAFTINTSGGEAYLRYNSFNAADELKKQVCTLNPTRFEIGPVYSAKPRDRKTLRPGALQPELRELVFDIDMTDYDPVRTCCSDADICKKCWPFISAAVKVLDRAIREEFGYEKLLWVYSGRRGIHLWISDKAAMELTDIQRKAVVGWLGVVQVGKDSSKKLNVRNAGTLPPSLQAALQELRTVFPALILRNQKLFASEEGYLDLLKCIPDSKMADKLSSKWEDSRGTSEERWEELLGEAKKNQNVWNAIEDVILMYTYPRLDAEVSKHRNHLLKAPFCVHPKTGRVCVPVDPHTVDSFDPSTVPTVGQLLRELDEMGNSNGEETKADWEKTSLKPYIELMNNHVRTVIDVKHEEDMTW